MKIVVFGFGTMGKLLCDAVKEHPHLDLVNVIEPYGRDEHQMVSANLEKLAPNFDVMIDFSHPANIQMILSYCTAHKKPLVICTTGFDQAALESITLAATFIPIVLASNTAQGVNLMHQLLRRAVQALAADFDIEIIEAHHNKKLDAPSGTANSLLKTIQEALPEPYKVEYGRQGMAKRTPKEIGIHSLRGGTLIGEHTVVLAGEDEIIEIKHTALSKKIFVKGAIRAAQFLHQKPSKLYTMEDVIQ